MDGLGRGLCDAVLREAFDEEIVVGLSRTALLWRRLVLGRIEDAIVY